MILGGNIPKSDLGYGGDPVIHWLSIRTGPIPQRLIALLRAVCIVWFPWFPKSAMTLEAGRHLDDPGSIFASSPARLGERSGGSRRQLKAHTFTLNVS